MNDNIPIVALLLAIPGVDPFAVWVRDEPCGPACLPACPTPLPAAAAWLDSASTRGGVGEGSRSRATAGRPARRSGARC